MIFNIVFNVYGQENKSIVKDTLRSKAQTIKSGYYSIEKQIRIPANAPVGYYKVDIKFTVYENNDIGDIEILTDPGYGFGDEIVRIINLLPKTDPNFLSKLKGDKKTITTSKTFFITIRD